MRRRFLGRWAAALAVGATLAVVYGAAAPVAVAADGSTPSWIDPSIQLEPIPIPNSPGCTIGDPSFFSHMVVSGLPSMASEDEHGVDHFVQGLINDGGRKVWFPKSGTSGTYTVSVPSLKAIWDNQQNVPGASTKLYEDPPASGITWQRVLDTEITPPANWLTAGVPSVADDSTKPDMTQVNLSGDAYSGQPYGIPINILTSTSKMIKYYTYPQKNPGQLGAFLSGWSNGSFVKLETGDAAHSQVAEYYGPNPQPDTYYPHPATQKYQGFPLGLAPNWDYFSLAAQPQTDGSCNLFETQGLNKGQLNGFNSYGWGQMPFGVSGAMKWNTATMRQNATQRRQGSGGNVQSADRALGADASRTPITAVLTRLSEVQPGHAIDHVMYFYTTGCSHRMVWPARQVDCDNPNSQYPNGQHPGDAPYGTVFRLPASYDPAANGITDPAALKIVDALKVHGMMVLGTGSDGLMMESANCPNKTVTAATTATCWGSDTIDQIKHIAYRDLEAVDTTDPTGIAACHHGGNFVSDDPTADDWFHMYSDPNTCPTGP
jgi:hypothetical protein